MNSLRLKWALIGFGIAALLFVLAGYLGYQFFLSSLLPALEMPLELKAPRVVAGASVLSKSLFVQDHRLGPVTDVFIGAEGMHPRIIVAGSRGAAFLGDRGRSVSTVVFSGRAGRVQIKDVDGDGVVEFVNRGEWAIDPSLIDHNGNTVWTYGSGVDDMASGDMDGDGTAEYAVGFNGGAGVHFLNKDGKLVSKLSDGNVWHVEIVDTNRDGLAEVVHSNAAGHMIIRDREGKIIRQIKPNPYLAEFSLVGWPRQTDPEYVLLSSAGTIWILDFDGKVVAEFPAPLSPEYGGFARGVPVMLQVGQPDCLAILVTLSHWQRSILYLYDPSGALVYQEILEGNGSAVAVLPTEEGDRETLLIGGEGKVWQYRQ